MDLLPRKQTKQQTDSDNNNYCNRASYMNVKLYNMIIVFRNDCSPGPSYMVDKKITRFGVDGTPMYSILGRSRNASEKTLHHY